MTKFKLTIEGMHCASCSSNVKKNLNKLSGVNDANVSLLTRKAFVETEENSKVSEEDLKSVVAKTGYTVTDIERG